jgi:hypothetical protein
MGSFRSESFLQVRELEGDGGVGQREERNDREADPRVQQCLEVLERGDRLQGRPAKAAQPLGPVRQRTPAPAAKDLAGAPQRLGECALSDVAARGSLQAEDDAGDRGVHARFVEFEPDEGTDHGVDEEAADAQAGEPGDGNDSQEAQGECRPVDARGVADGDDQDGTNIVGDRQRQQQDAKARRDPAPENGHAADHERDVGRHRDSPAPRRRAAVLQRQVDGGGRDHAAEGGGHRKRGTPGIAKLADHELALDLESDDEEEHRHQSVADPVLERVAQLEGAEPELDRGLPESEKGIGPGGIGEGKRCDGRRQQDDASGRLDVEEAFEGTDEAVDRLAGEDGGRSACGGGFRCRRDSPWRVSCGVEEWQPEVKPGQRRGSGGRRATLRSGRAPS